MEVAPGVDIRQDLVGTTVLKAHIRAHECREWLERNTLYTHAELPGCAFKVGQRHQAFVEHKELFQAVCAKLDTPATIQRIQAEIVYRSHYERYVTYLNDLKTIYEIGIYMIFLGRDSP